MTPSLNQGQGQAQRRDQGRHLRLFSSTVFHPPRYSRNCCLVPPSAVVVFLVLVLVVEMLSTTTTTTTPPTAKFGEERGCGPNTSNPNPDRAERVWWLLAQAQDFQHRPAGNSNKIIAAADQPKPTPLQQPPLQPHLQGK